jgi:CheY-like chemotaxis protein
MAKILLVEDDPLIYKMYEKAFGFEDFEVETAHNGQEGLDKLRHGQPDVVLLDIMMPGMNGIEVLSKVKHDPDTKDIPIIVLTNISDMRTAHEITTHGANLTLIKSEAEPDQVIAWVHSVLNDGQNSGQEPSAASDNTSKTGTPSQSAERQPAPVTPEQPKLFATPASDTAAENSDDAIAPGESLESPGSSEETHP